MNWKKLEDLVKQGYGQGHFNEYGPWLWLRRRNPSKQGNQVSGSLPGYFRRTSFWARIEWHFALLCLWLGAIDVREQYPLWPMPHQHPLADFPGVPRPKVLPEQRGLMKIAHEAGIDHGWEVGHPDVPYIATVDLAVTRVVDGELALSLLASKPLEQLKKASPASSLVGRLELQRRYASEVRASLAIADASLIGEHFGSNLENYAAAAILPERLSDLSRFAEYCQFVSEESERETINDAIAAASDRFQLNPDDASLLFRAGVWHRRIDVDLSDYIVTSYPRKAGASLAAAIERELFRGGVA